MIAIRKDYSEKFKYVSSPPSTPDKLEVTSPTVVPHALKREPLLKPIKRSIKPISILQRYDYHKTGSSGAGGSQPKIVKVDNKTPTSAIPAAAPAPKIPQSPVKKELKVICQRSIVNETPVVKQEVVEQTKINNKINIIFQLNDNKSLRKNIILHRRTPKKMVQKITIKETNNNSDDAAVPEKVSVDTQTEVESRGVNLTTTSPLQDEPTEHLFFDDNVLISLQRSTISFFEFSRLGALLKKGEVDFKLIDRIPRRNHDQLIDSDNKFQCLCYNETNWLPIYVEMRGKQKELEDPEQCPIAFLYCNVYYIDQRRAKFTSVHLDTVKSSVGDIMYTCVPRSSYFIMAWNEKAVDTKGLDTGIVKYKLTPNLDLAKLASIRQFPKLNYCTKQINCGKGEGEGLWVEVECLSETSVDFQTHSC
jgi:hypothetical protein